MSLRRLTTPTASTSGFADEHDVTEENMSGGLAALIALSGIQGGTGRSIFSNYLLQAKYVYTPAERTAIKGIAMSACSAINFSNFTPEMFSCLQNAVWEQFGIRITANSGKVSKDGFTVKWNYEPAPQKLMIQCTDSPFYIPCSAINKRIVSVVKSCGGSTDYDLESSGEDASAVAS